MAFWALSLVAGARKTHKNVVVALLVQGVALRLARTFCGAFALVTFFRRGAVGVYASGFVRAEKIIDQAYQRHNTGVCGAIRQAFSSATNFAQRAKRTFVDLSVAVVVEAIADFGSGTAQWATIVNDAIAVIVFAISTNLEHGGRISACGPCADVASSVAGFALAHPLRAHRACVARFEY